MTRLELAWLLIVVVGLAMAAALVFLAVLFRERRRRQHWSTRTRAARPHWSIAFAVRVERLADRLSSRRRRFRPRRRRDR